MKFKRKAVRAFEGSGGSRLAKINERVIIEEELRKGPELCPYVTAERSITEKRRSAPKLSPTKHRPSQKLDVRISSADLDPSLEPVQIDAGDGHFQTVAFDPYLGAGSNPHADLMEFGEHTEETGDPEKDRENGVSTIGEVCQALGKEGFVVRQMKGQKVRPCAPAWIRTSLSEFILGRVDQDHRTIETLPFWALIDFLILQQHYLSYRSDEDIFYMNWELFKKDKTGTRWTSSTNAVKLRRIKLLKQGNELYADKEDDFQPNPDARPELRKLDAGAGGHIRECQVPGCPNRAETSEPIQGVYICEAHPVRVQKHYANVKAHRSVKESTSCDVSTLPTAMFEGEKLPTV
jgi:hypothetical protein